MKAGKIALNIIKWTGITLIGVVFVLFAVGLWLDKPMPEGYGSPQDADRLARKVQATVNLAEWDSTGAIQWTFAGMNRHLWDRERGYAEVRWGNTRVLVDLNTQRGVAYENGGEQIGQGATELVKQAYSMWVNDAFWLNPVAKFFDEGTTRELVKWEDGSTGLMVHYNSGGVTPGDSYGWELGPDNKPTGWHMWVSVLPVGGLYASWEDWQQLSTGAWMATAHKFGPVGGTMITDAKAAPTLEELVPNEEDPFAALEKRK